MTEEKLTACSDCAWGLEYTHTPFSTNRCTSPEICEKWFDPWDGTEKIKSKPCSDVNKRGNCPYFKPKD